MQKLSFIKETLKSSFQNLQVSEEKILTAQDPCVLISGFSDHIQIPPSQNKKFGFKVEPPHGEERLKAIATLDRDFPVNLNLNSGKDFHVIKPETSQGMREIKTLANFFSSKQNSDWSQDYLKIFIHKKNNIFSRGQRTIPSTSEIFENN